MTPIDVTAPTHSLAGWEPRDQDLKTYIHFDRDLPRSEIVRIANDPVAVAQNPFFPLLLFHERWRKFRKDGTVREKVRPIRFSCRRDAAIYAAYRSKLSKLYEAELARRSLLDVPVAYRRIPKASGGYKCNIEIARDVFKAVQTVGDCHVTVVDIKSYFESLDHARILQVWECLLGEALPPDHSAVFKSITEYSVVDVDKLFARLGMHEKGAGTTRVERRRRKIDTLRKVRHKQICSPKDFRDVVLGKDGKHPSLIQKNGFSFGIPQGTPLSDVVANFYLIDFDQNMNAWTSSLGGIYRRYSDDIVVILPSASGAAPMEAKLKLQAEIRRFGTNLKIQDKKVAICSFHQTSQGLVFQHVFGSASKNGLEYLGFEFDGKIVKIKNSSLSNAWRKLKKKAYGRAWRYVKQYRAKGKVWLDQNYPYSDLETRFLRDVTFNQDVGYESWTFTKYIKRASKAFIEFDAIFSKQTQRYRRHTRFIIESAYQKALAIHFK